MTYRTLATLDAGGKMPVTQLPDGAATDAELAAAVTADRRTLLLAVTASRTLTATDEGLLLWDQVAAGATITVPTDAALNLPVGYWVDIQRLNTAGQTGTTTISAAGVTLVSEGGKTAVMPGGRARLHKVAAGVWALTGNLQSAIVTPTLINGFGNFAGWSVLRYWLEGHTTFLVGLWTVPVLAVGTETQMFTLGVGYRPPADIMLTGLLNGYVPYRIDVAANGVVEFVNSSTTATTSGQFLSVSGQWSVT